MQVNEIPMGSLIDQDKIKTILSDSVYMDIFSDGADVLRQGNDTTLTLTDLIQPPEHASQIGKVFAACGFVSFKLADTPRHVFL